ncbi:hypothetical protein LBMAG53_18530 [Planctomycetota bacterium]|nr:hypothetical protein LBMAG53_18530 [Planctomycetota bacterium]
MYLDILPNANLAEPCMATFATTGTGVAVVAVRLWRDERWQWCAVTGWSDAGPVPAWWHPIEESGDGPARLLTGGECGLRLAQLPGNRPPAPHPGPTRWDLDDAGQWAEGFLILRPETEIALA